MMEKNILYFCDDYDIILNEKWMTMDWFHTKVYIMFLVQMMVTVHTVIHPATLLDGLYLNLKFLGKKVLEWEMHLFAYICLACTFEVQARSSFDSSFCPLLFFW